MKTQAILGTMVFGTIVAASSFGGCGTEGDSTFDAGGASSGASGASGGASGTSGGPCIGNCGASSGEGGTSSGGTSGNPLEECAQQTLGGTLLPFELEMIFDKSSSMCYSVSHGAFDCADETTSWPATSQALRTFFAAQSSAGLTVAVRSFGATDGVNPNTHEGNRCDPADYSTIEFGPVDLPSTTFGDQVLATLPDFTGNNGNLTMTQTGPAIAGTTIYANQRKTELNGSKGIALLLVSDGEPTGCGANVTGVSNPDTDLQAAVDAAAAANQAGYKLYVLGLGGGNTAKLGQIAQAGGTEVITVADPTDSSAIAQALASVRGQTLSCELAIPQPADGLQPDFSKLNVTFTPPGGAVQVLGNTTDCTANPNGWQYDNPDAPTKIELCPQICETVLASVTGQLNVVLGCETSTGPVH